MKTLLFPFLLYASSCIGQTGSVLIKCADAETRQTLPRVALAFSKDSVTFNATTDATGLLLQRRLPVGEVRFLMYPGHQKDTIRGTVFIQENQLAQLELFIDTKNSWLYQGETGNSIQFSEKGSSNLQPNPFNYPGTLSSLSVQEIQCVVVTAYSIPLINRDNSSGSTITREDLTRLPVRSVNGIASTVGGVNSTESFDDVHIRGSRSNSTAYYLDGIRISNPNSIPRSFISDVSVYTGGIPANYGDLTGGVISVQSTTYNRLDSDRNGRKRRRNLSYIEPDPEPFGLTRIMSYDNFLPVYENDFLSPKDHPHSTFGLDVDRASWTFIKRQIAQGGYITRDAVKLEEMINSFQTGNVSMQENELMSVAIERNVCSWNPDHELVTIHLQAKPMPRNEKRKIHNLVFLIDVSGSMNSPDRLELLIAGLKRFVKTLDERDRVAIVTYAGYSAVVLEPTKCNEQNEILEALERLVSGGSTNGIGGIMEAYTLAERNFDPALNNRIILCTDGDFNVGINSPGDLEKYIEEKRGKGIYLTALGFGMGNYHNSTLETLADKGDGNHFYIRDLYDMNKVLVEDAGNLLKIARDVKLNVEFNPSLVKSYRLIGYENRLLKPKDFVDDTKDGGEIGYGHSVTAVYEIERGTADAVESHFQSQMGTPDPNELAFVKLRYKPFEEKSSIERRYSLSNQSPLKQNELLNLVIGLGLHLRDSAFTGTQTVSSLQRMANSFQPENEEEFELKRIILSLQ
jgi:Ca-activated chloride channel family protein